MMVSGRDPREGIFSIFRVDCSLVVGLCFYSHYYTLYTASREWALYGAALFANTHKYLLHPQVLRGSDATPTQPLINPISISAQR